MNDEIMESALVVKAKPIRKVFKAPGKVNKIPGELLNDPILNASIAALPSNYNFEIHKTIWRIRETKSKRVALQMPEGLLMYATTIADIIENFTNAETVIVGDVTYGACCIDDYTARALDADFMVHYGHSCLVPIDQTTGIKVLYVFVDIQIDIVHGIECVKATLPVTTRISLVSTIQFASSLPGIAQEMRNSGYEVKLPQIKPLSPGEILGCTVPRIRCSDAIVYIGDGRFHLEAAMIANPGLRAFKYDPYEKKLTEEYYNHVEMRETRLNAIQRASKAEKICLILGTLGRQGNPNVMNNLENKMKSLERDAIVVLLSEIFPDKIKLFSEADAFIQIACPRLSIDWGVAFEKPFLTPYEGAAALGMIGYNKNDAYPMDFYAYGSLGPWTPNHKESHIEKDTKACEKCQDLKQ